MDQIIMSALKRDETGKSASRRLRYSGKVPAVLYGREVEGSIPLALDAKELYGVLHTAAGENAIIGLTLEGEKETRMVMVKEIVRNPVRDDVEHVDLLAVVFGKKMTVEVPIQITGKAEGQTLGGILQHGVRKVTVECLPRAIPDTLTVDVTPLVIGQAVHLKDIDLPDGVEIADDPELTVVSIVAPMAEAEAEATTAEEAEEELAKSFEEKGEETEEGEKEKEKE